VEILGPDRDQWLVKGADATALADALAAVPRPPGRLRVAVDPARL
jgi:primosomal protein N' (replication factor Y)